MRDFHGGCTKEKVEGVFYGYLPPAMPGLAWAGFGSCISDIRALSRSETLVASGSTISMWGSHIGSGAMNYPEGQMRWRFRAGGPDFETEVDAPADLESSWMRRAVVAVTTGGEETLPTMDDRRDGFAGVGR